MSLLQAPRRAEPWHADRRQCERTRALGGRGLDPLQAPCRAHCKPRAGPTASPVEDPLQARCWAGPWRARRRQCRWNTWLQGSFLLRPAGAISSRQMMQMPSQRARSSALASCAAPAETACAAACCARPLKTEPLLSERKPFQ